MRIREVAEIIEKAAPLSTAEDYDNVGLLVGDAEEQVTGVLIAVDVTEMVISEAIEKGCNLIVSHHPVIFHPLKSVLESNMTERTVAFAIKGGVSLYAAHTNADKMPGNMSERLARALGGKRIKPIIEGGYGVICDVESVSFKALFARVKEILQDPRARSVGNMEDSVERVAIVSGCGGRDDELISAARAQGAQVYISGEFRHDVALSAYHDGFCLIETGHYLSEKSFTKIMAELLTKAGVDVGIKETSTESNPYN